MKVQVDEVVIEGKTYVPKDSIKTSVPVGDVKIVVLQRGWVVVGRMTRDDEMCTLEGAHVIRCWGTSKGLGEIALNGPTSSTQLDPAGRIDFHVMTTILVINCQESKWANYL